MGVVHTHKHTQIVCDFPIVCPSTLILNPQCAPPFNALALKVVSGLQVAKTLNERISQLCQVTLEVCAYAGTGDVLKIQQLLALCSEQHSAGAEEPAPWQVCAPVWFI